MSEVAALPAQSYVYVIGDPSGPQKVGFAADPARRLALFRTGNMGDLRIAIAAPITRDLAREAERYTHWLLREHHARGEWFSVSPEDACAAVEEAIRSVTDGARAPSLGFGCGGRRKLWPEHVNLSLPGDGKAAMDAALLPGEDRLDLIRAGIDRELRARGHEPMPPNEVEKAAKPS